MGDTSRSTATLLEHFLEISLCSIFILFYNPQINSDCVNVKEGKHYDKPSVSTRNGLLLSLPFIVCVCVLNDNH